MLNAFMSAEIMRRICILLIFMLQYSQVSEALHDFENGALNLYLFEFSCLKGYNYEKGLHDLNNDALDQHLFGFFCYKVHMM